MQTRHPVRLLAHLRWGIKGAGAETRTGSVQEYCIAAGFTLLALSDLYDTHTVCW